MKMTDKNVESLINPTKPESCYLLGLLWADGWISKDSNSVAIEIMKSDMDDISKVFSKWNMRNRKRENRKRVSCASISNYRLHKFLINCGFREKGIRTPRSILSKIPFELRYYWWRGYFDGDGCFYDHQDKIRHYRQVYFTSSYKQDWTEHKRMLKRLRVKYSFLQRITKQKRVGGRLCRYSQIRFTNKDHIKIFGNFIYQGKQFGLKRKLDKFRQMFKK